jgi:hypothetical protein
VSDSQNKNAALNGPQVRLLDALERVYRRVENPAVRAALECAYLDALWGAS